MAAEAKAGSESGRGRQRSCSPALLKNLKHVLWQSEEEGRGAGAPEKHGQYGSA